jgi:hypothetical protein
MVADFGSLLASWEFKMKKSGNPQIGGRKANNPLPTHKEIVAKITEENRAFFAKKDRYRRLWKKGIPYPRIEDQSPNLELAQPRMDSETGSGAETLQPYQAAHTQRIAAPKNKSFQLPKGFWKIVLVSVLALGVAVGLSYMAASALVDVANHPSKPAAPNFNNDPYASAYEAAKKFATQTYPSAKSFSSFNDTGITFVSDKGFYQVELIMDFANGTDEPAKRSVVFSVFLDRDDQWKLLKIYTDTE